MTKQTETNNARGTYCSCPECGNDSEYGDHGSRLLCTECTDARPEETGYEEAGQHGYDY